MLNETVEALTTHWLSLLDDPLIEKSERNKAAVDFYCTQIIPALLPGLRKRFQDEHTDQRHEGRYDSLISLMGYTPETTVISYRFAEPQRLAVLYTKETEHLLSEIQRLTGLPAGALLAEVFDKHNMQDLWRALDRLLERLGRRNRLAIELTGGTKPMGAALQMAAAVMDIDTLYIDYDDYMPEYRKPRPLSTYVRLMENPIKNQFNLLRPVHLGLMATAAAHELNQPIGIIRAMAQAALLDIQDNKFQQSEIIPLLEGIQSQTQRMAAVVDNFRRFSRGNRAAQQDVDLNQLVIDTVKLFSNQYRERNIQLKLNLDPQPLWAQGNLFLLEEVLLNLLSNARDALDGRKDGVVSVATLRYSSSRCGFTVEDNGPGLPDPYRNLLFVPFMSTKSTEKGSGMGLFVSRRILDDLGGQLRYEDRVGGGACFIVELLLRKSSGSHQSSALVPTIAEVK